MGGRTNALANDFRGSSTRGKPACLITVGGAHFAKTTMASASLLMTYLHSVTGRIG